MLKRLMTYFIKGILTFLPIALTIYVVVWIFNVIDGIIGRYFIAVGIDIPGLGLLTTLVFITLIGIMSNLFLSRRIIDFLDRIMGNMPLVKLIYSIIKETTHALLGNKNYFGQVVMLSLPGDADIKILGFITAEDAEMFNLKDYVAVYILQSMQWAGFTFLVPRDRVEILDMKTEVALQFIVSAGITGKENGKTCQNDPS